jgi:hypothetical protein
LGLEDLNRCMNVDESVRMWLSVLKTYSASSVKLVLVSIDSVPQTSTVMGFETATKPGVVNFR